MESARKSPPNSLLLVLDPETGELPQALGGQSIVASLSALAIGTLEEFAGDTEVVLAAEFEQPRDASLAIRWEGFLETSGRLAVMTVYGEILLESKAPASARVQVWTNDASEPDLVWVVVGEVL